MEPAGTGISLMIECRRPRGCHSPRAAQIMSKMAMKALTLELLELARVLARLDHVAS
jgi:hypothetical protein